MIVHAATADAYLSILVHGSPNRESSPRMELRSDRAVATLDMSQAKTNEDEPFNVGGDYESLPPHVSVMTHMTAGAVAGILEHTVMYPVDSVKVTATEKLWDGILFSFIPVAN